MIYTLLCIIIAILCIRLYNFKKAARKIAEDFIYKLKTDTNTLISVSSSDKDLKFLANTINKQLRKLRKEHYRYTQGDKELKNAVTNISHDLRTPLTAICGYLDVMKKSEKTPQMEHYIDILSERADTMKQLTEELFKYSIIMSEENISKNEEILVNQVLEDSIMGYYAALNEKGIVPEINITEKKIVKILDKTSLARVFSNLINNAIKYSEGDLKITLSDSGVIVFSNTASSLNVVQVEHLFDRFYTVETGRNSTGLGLSIARTLLEQMNGSISAKLRNHQLIITIIV